MADCINSNKKQKVNSNQEEGVPCANGFSGEGLCSTFSCFAEDDSFAATDSDDHRKDAVEHVPGCNLDDEELMAEPECLHFWEEEDRSKDEASLHQDLEGNEEDHSALLTSCLCFTHELVSLCDSAGAPLYF